MSLFTRNRATVTVAIGLFFVAQSFGADAPNILWIVTDDQRVDSIASFNRIRHGESDSPLGHVLSPNVDRLARMGTTFINTFNQNPACAPSRTLMHTGRYSHHTGVYGFEYYNPTGQSHWRPMVPEILRDKAGYQTLAVGKLGIRAQHFANQKGGTEPPLYQTNLGYRKEFSAKGMVDWNKETKWVNGQPGPANETFYFPGGEQLVWPEFAESTPNDREEIQQRLRILRHYMPEGEDKQSGSILGGLNPQSGERTRDGSFTGALLDHLAHAGEQYTDMLGRQQQGPAANKPLFAYVGFEFPHTPVLPPAEFREKFQELDYQIPEFTEEEFASFPPQLKKLFNNSQSDHFTDAEKHQMIADYYAFCAYGDSLVGKAVDGFIEFSEKQDRPWLVLYVCGDHGWRLNEHGMVSKFSHYDTDLHNPLIVLSSDKQKFPAGKVVEDFTEFVDMAPTFLAAAGINLQTPEYAYLDGRDLARTATRALPPRDYIIAEPTWVIGPRAVIRTKDYKFAMKIRSRTGHTMTNANVGKDFKWALSADLKDIEPTLFDLRSDPEEIHNVAFDKRYRPVLDALRAKLQDIILGDGRVEIAWTKTGINLPTHQSNFASGANDGRFEVPEISISGQHEPPASSFPYEMPIEKPSIPLSEAMERAYDAYDAPTYWRNELFSKFCYTPLEGFDYNAGDGTLSRRDPSKVVKANGKYYVWYTRRSTGMPPGGTKNGTDVTPSTDWDLSEIWYATSEDGFVWKEQGVAVPRPPKPHVGWRSVCTPDVLFWKGKYYLYYQGFTEMSGTRGDDCPVTVSWADSPDGPWTPTHKIVVPTGPDGAWDQYSIHDPYPLVYRGRIYLYYKSDFNGKPESIRAQGLAIADDPLGPFEKCPINPVLNSGHETGLFPFRDGIAALAIRHGNEQNTIQFAPDGINFKVASITSLLPIAPGPYVPDAFTNTQNGRGITWGLSHFTTAGTPTTKHSILARFDCDLSQDEDDRHMKDPEHYWPPEFYFRSGLGEGARDKRERKAKEDLTQGSLRRP